MYSLLPPFSNCLQNGYQALRFCDFLSLIFLRESQYRGYALESYNIKERVSSGVRKGGNM